MTTHRFGSRRVLALVLALVLVPALAACGGDDDDDDGGSTPKSPDAEGRVTLVAEGNEWDADTIEVGVGEEVTIIVDNQDSVSHNLHIKDLPGGDVTTKLEKGPVEQELEVSVDEAGSYDYVCDIHPNMDGKLVVA